MRVDPAVVFLTAIIVMAALFIVENVFIVAGVAIWFAPKAMAAFAITIISTAVIAEVVLRLRERRNTKVTEGSDKDVAPPSNPC